METNSDKNMQKISREKGALFNKTLNCSKKDKLFIQRKNSNNPKAIGSNKK